MGDTQCFDMGKTRGKAMGSGGVFLRQSQVLSLILHAGGGGDGQIPYMGLPDHRVGNGHSRPPVQGPSVGIGTGQVNNHAPLPVDAACSGVGVDGLPGDSIHGDKIGVINPVQVTVQGESPCSPDVRHQGIFACGGAAAAVGIEPEADGGCRGGPEPEPGAPGAPRSTQVVTGIGKGFFKAVAGIVHNPFSLYCGIFLCRETEALVFDHFTTGKKNCKAEKTTKRPPPYVLNTSYSTPLHRFIFFIVYRLLFLRSFLSVFSKEWPPRKKKSLPTLLELCVFFTHSIRSLLPQPAAVGSLP